MKSSAYVSTLLAAAAFAGCATSKPEMEGNLHHALNMESFYLPNAEASRVVSVTTNGVAPAAIVVQTQRVAVKESGPKETVEKFGEVYAFSPTFFAVHRDEATRIRFWNLQPDDHHALMLIDPHLRVLMNLWLPPLTETAYVFTFHEEGLFNFVCSLHPTPMNGQILVLPLRSSSK
jgi:plastocyanin